MFGLKKLLVVLFALSVVTLRTQAQGFIVQWLGGYAWQPGSTQPMPAQLFNSQAPTVDAWSNLANVNDATNSYKAVNNSYGHGFNINMLVGYMINPYVGFGLGISYQKSAVISATQVRDLYLNNDSLNVPQATGGYISSAITTQSQNLTLSPSLILTYNKPKYKFYPYLRAGLTLPVFTVIEQHVDMTLQGAGAYYAAPDFLGSVTSTGLETYTNFSMGFNGALGVGYKPYPFLHLFLEINAQYLNMKGDFSQVTEWTADGQDFNYNGNYYGINGRGTYRSVFEYVKTLNGSSNNAAYNNNYNTNNAKQEISPNFPFSYIGFNFGVQLILNKKIFKDQDKFEEERALRVQKRVAKKKKAEDTPPADSNTPNNTTPAGR
jgi:Outer membrane protein beta-barrel domain